MKRDTSKKQDQDEFFETEEQLAVSVTEATSGDQLQNPVLQLQLTMATNSINHEYARIEFDDTDNQERREELLEFMSLCRQKYFEARQSLEVHDPNALQEFEADLMRQKVETLGRFNA